MFLPERTAKNYRHVLQKIVSLFPDGIQLKHLWVDFEAAVWCTYQEVLPRIGMFGCALHFTQSVFRHIFELGLKIACL